jgi:hypothetical protein
MGAGRWIGPEHASMHEVMDAHATAFFGASCVERPLPVRAFCRTAARDSVERAGT